MTTTPERLQHVYAWVVPDWRPADAPRALPAVRLWGDVLLELVAASRARPVDPPVDIRRSSVFAWMRPLPPEQLAATTAGRRRVELAVSPELCAAARVDVVHELFDPISWRRLREWLIDRGHDRDFIEEDVVVFANPMAPMLVEAARHSVESTSPNLLEEIVNYFGPVANGYLDSWGRLADAEHHESLEVVVPPNAILEVLG